MLNILIGHYESLIKVFGTGKSILFRWFSKEEKITIIYSIENALWSGFRLFLSPFGDNASSMVHSINYAIGVHLKSCEKYKVGNIFMERTHWLTVPALNMKP